MILVTPHQSIVAVLASSPATQPDFSSTAAVLSGATRSGYRQRHGTLNSTTEVVVVENPSGSESRDIVDIQIANRHSSAVVCTVSLKEGNTYRVLVETSIGVDETLQWTGSQWKMFPEPVSSIGAVDIVVSGDVTLGDDLSVGDDATITGDLVVTGTTTTNTWVYNAFTGKGELIASTADNTPGILAAATYDYHVLTSRASASTGLAWGHRAHLIHMEASDSAAYHTSATESAALYSSPSIPTEYINEIGTTIRVCVEGIASTTSNPNITCRIKFNDGSSSQAINTPTTGTPGTTVTDVLCQWEGQYTVRSTGATGTIQGWQKGTAGGTTAQNSRADGLITLDLTNDLVIEVTLTWGTSSASNTATLRHFTVEILKP